MEIISGIFSALVAQGPLGILAAVGLAGWLAVGYLLKRQYGQKDESSKLKGSHSKENKKIHDEYQKKLEELNERNNKNIIDMSDKRISDLKDLCDEYNTLATNTLNTLDKLTSIVHITSIKNKNS